MRRLLSLFGAAACAVLLLHPAARAVDPTPVGTNCQGVFCAGAARGDITPPVTTPMWGYTARELGDHWAGSADKLAAGDPASVLTAVATDPAVADKLGGDTEGYCKTFECNQGIQIRLYANAFVLRDAHGTKLAVVQVDLGGLPSEVHQAVADKIQAATGIDAAHLLISATHTHQGPGGIFQYQGYALLGGDEFDPRVFAAVVDGISGAVTQADAALAPAKLAWAQTEEDDANHNRTIDQWCLDPEASCANGQWTGTGPTPNNGTLTVVRLDRVKDGSPIGVITNLANHGTLGGDDNLLFSGDNQGFATRDVEAGIAAASPASAASPGAADPIDALVNGAQGDQAPDGYPGDAWNGIGGTRSSYAAMEGAGRVQAAAVLDVWKGLADKLTSDVTLDARMEQVCFCGQQVNDPGPNYDNDPAWDRVSATPMLGAGGVTLGDGTAGPAVIPTQGTKLPALAGNGTGPQAVRIQQLRIGDLLIGTVPGEPTVQLGRRIIGAMRAAAGPSINGAIVAGLADDYVSYFTTHEEYRSHDYEASFTLYGPQSGELLLEQQAALAKAIVTKADVAACTPTPICPTPTYPSSAAVEPAATTIDGPFSWTALPAPAATTYQTVSASWVGGSPSAEWAPGQDRVRIQRLVGNAWRTVAADALDFATLLSHTTVNGQHIWTAQWEVTRDMPTGTYRFEVLGHLGQGPGMPTVAYVQDSRSITVTERPGPCPPPDPAASFRYRGDCS